MKNLKIATILAIVISMILSLGMIAFAEETLVCENHTLGDWAWPADYTECGGGFKEDIYECSECGTALFADGSEAERIEGNGQHTVGELFLRPIIPSVAAAIKQMCMGVPTAGSTLMHRAI